jgi:hypothetical protein
VHGSASSHHVSSLELSETEMKRRPYTNGNESKAKDVAVYGTYLPRLWRRLPPPGLRAAITATGSGIVFIFENQILVQPLSHHYTLF